MIDLLGFGAQGWGGVLLLAALMTLLVTLAALLVGALLGALVAAAKLQDNGLLRVLGDAYTTVFRGVPELLVIYLFFYGGSALVGQVGQLFGAEGFIGMPAFLVGALAVGVVSGAYQAEVYRGAFQAVSRNELEAAKAIGMPMLMRFRRIIAPQVLRFALPGLGGVWQISLKDSALISVTGLVELMRASRVAAASTGEFVLFFMTGCALYLLLTGVSNLVFSRAELRLGRTLRRG
ncbi:ABC transporter permease subunit [Pseudomonas guariconensis]|uniref:ABC transporter permease n=1 Tax=Pseudomonas TaxID=286 RepID=UPI0020981146|nr:MULTISPECIES: ABC transporter permease subunit [Pseudomonas]MCO7636364.1 ABC transporter permease subunit [Pseudomonas sp. S 311-6]MCO7516052.1 ABC transporter permease subunit [Pseudomonas putida]MCO7563793.1 ABC transporter permease subunit [Pseudomonas mosselii]MCO7594146.1 ABC transporter permease subunit [Pseudomonas guariconensis]MCO7606758.1 ABC transporter permease subunit [Pseudomonas guariconensis]